MNNKHLAYATILTGVAGVADQIAGTGVLSALGPWGAVAGALVQGVAMAYLHRPQAGEAPVPLIGQDPPVLTLPSLAQRP